VLILHAARQERVLQSEERDARRDYGTHGPRQRHEQGEHYVSLATLILTQRTVLHEDDGKLGRSMAHAQAICHTSRGRELPHLHVFPHWPHAQPLPRLAQDWADNNERVDARYVHTCFCLSVFCNTLPQDIRRTHLCSSRTTSFLSASLPAFSISLARSTLRVYSPPQCSSSGAAWPRQRFVPSSKSSDSGEP